MRKIKDIPDEVDMLSKIVEHYHSENLELESSDKLFLEKLMQRLDAHNGSMESFVIGGSSVTKLEKIWQKYMVPKMGTFDV